MLENWKRILRRFIPILLLRSVRDLVFLPQKIWFISKNLFQYYPLNTDKLKQIKHQIENNKNDNYRKYKLSLKHPFLLFRYLHFHHSYDKLILFFVPKWTPVGAKRKFFGQGGGRGNVNTYRKVEMSGQVFIEKIYLDLDSSLKRSSSFYDAIYPIIKKEITSPILYQKMEGEPITVAYYEFLDLSKKEFSKNCYPFNEVLINLYKVSKKYEDEIKISKLPSFIYDYTIHRCLRPEYFQELNLILNEKSIIDKIRQNIENSPAIISHNDFNYSNVFKDNIIIDWDTFGMYPLGLEMAYNFVYLNDFIGTHSTLSNYLKDNFSNAFGGIDWKHFELNFYYFFLCFTQKEDLSEKFIHEREEALQYLKSIS